MSKPILHQLTEAAAPRDAMTDHARQIQGWLRQMGFISDIYTLHMHPDLEKEIKPLSSYHPTPQESLVIYHHGIGSEVVNTLLDLPAHQQVILIYHNITPPEFFAELDPALTRQLIWGREQLPLLVPRTRLALGVSPFNTGELQAVGFAQTDVLPIGINDTLYRETPSNPALLQAYKDSGPLLLFVGRQSPNKKQEDLLKLLYYVRRIDSTVRLVLIGSPWTPPYARWLQDLNEFLHLDQATIFANHVTFQDMITYYRLADLYVSMSEHEGFGKPFIESMLFDLPVMAYASSGIPGTLGDAGVLFHEKNFEALAELVCILLQDQTMRHKLLARQRQRLPFYLEAEVKELWHCLINGLPEFH